MSRTGSSVTQPVDRLPAVVAATVGALVSIGCVELGRRQRGGAHSAALTGVAVGVVYAATAALLKSLSDIAVLSPLQVFASWQLYAVVALGAVGLLLSQVAFQAGPITASLPATASVDPLLSIVIGVLVFDERLKRGMGGGVALVAMIALLGVAIIQLTRSPDAA